jgi:hypothetical protein
MNCTASGGAARQFLAILPVYILQLCYGMSSSFPAITTPQVAAGHSHAFCPKLRMDCSQMKITDEDESWIGRLEHTLRLEVRLFTYAYVDAYA